MVSRCWLAAFATRAFRFKAFDVVRPWGWDVVGHPGKGLPRDDDLGGRDFGQRIGGVDFIVLDVRA